MAFEAARLISGRAAPTLTLVEAYVALVQARYVGQLMKHLSSELPLGPLQHLKRVRPHQHQSQQQQQQQQQGGVEVLLCLKQGLQQLEQQQQQQQTATGPAQDAAAATTEQQQQQHSSDTQALALLPPSTARALAAASAQLLVARVPLHQPDTRQQWAEWSQLWPMPWRVPSGADEQDGAPATAAEQAYFEQHMAAALAASAAAGGSNVAVIVDPRSNTVLAHAVDCSSRHPLDHAAMVAVEVVAARDRQLWPFNGFAHLGRHADAPDDAGYVAVAPHHHTRSDSTASEDAARPPKKHKAAAGASSSQDQPGHEPQQQQQQDRQQEKPNGPPAAGDNNGMGQGGPAGTSSSSSDAPGFDWSAKPYLCTGYDAFLAAEPCTMCAMALLHSRLARVVYCKQSRSHGALGGRYRLHEQKTLNHHYKVYHLPLRQQQEEGAAEQQQQQGQAQGQ